MHGLSQQERMQQILRMLETRASVPVSELSLAFAVSEVTVRSDLASLARQGLVARVRGGVRALQQGQSEVGFDLRLRLEVERKRAIARAAASLIGEGEAVALDASTTSMPAVRHASTSSAGALESVTIPVRSSIGANESSALRCHFVPSRIP
jgi:DeoR/GlpR family transcriptional regulator of sugar metabolism